MNTREKAISTMTSHSPCGEIHIASALTAENDAQQPTLMRSRRGELKSRTRSDIRLLAKSHDDRK